MPIPFELPYEPAKIDLSHRYTVRAQIRRGGGEPMLTSTTSSPVLTHGAPANVDLTLQSVGAAGADASTTRGAPAAELIETYWQYLSLLSPGATINSLEHRHR